MKLYYSFAQAIIQLFNTNRKSSTFGLKKANVPSYRAQVHYMLLPALVTLPYPHMLLPQTAEVKHYEYVRSEN